MKAADQRVNPNHLPFDVHQRTAAIPGIDVGISLQKVLVHERAALAENDIRAALRANVAIGNAVIETEWGANSDREFANACFGRISQRGHRKSIRFNFNY